MTKLIFIFIIVAIGAYNLMLDIVRYRSAGNPTPESVSDIYDSETYLKWKMYSAEHSKLNIISLSVNCFITVTMLATEVYAPFASLFPSGFFWQTFAVILLETAIGFVTETVKSYVSTMVIEEKYGFNKSSIKTFIFDRIRSLILEFLLSLCLAMLVAVTYEKFGAWMILLFAVILFVFTLVISFLYPIFSKIGNKFIPLEDGELKERLSELLNKHGYTVKSIDVMDASRRTTKLNAYFTGFGKMKQIVLFDNLVNAMSTEEICAVFSHELGHGLHKDVPKNQILNTANMLILAVIAWFAAGQTVFYTDMGFGAVNYGFAFIIIGLLAALYQPVLGIVINAVSRRAEYRADKQAVSEGYGEAMISALKKLAKDNFAHLSPSRINVILEYSHPPLASRIEAIEKELRK